LNPPTGVIVTAVVACPPSITVTLLGLADRVKLAEGITTRFRVVVSVKLPEVPVTVTVAKPVVAVGLAASVRVLELVAGFGLNDAVTPLGKPEADSETLSLQPFEGVIRLCSSSACLALRSRCSDWQTE
jgi:hypothetical protein